MPHAGAIIGLVGAAWLAAAVAATLFAIRRKAAADQALAEAAMVANLLAASPAAPLLVYANRGLDADPRLARWLGLATPPATWADLAAGGILADAELEQLDRGVAALLATGEPFELRLTLPSNRALLCRGAPFAVTGVARPAALLWFSDISGAQGEIVRLRARTARLGRAIDGLSALIEAAPFPMWHRGPDLSLALVNGAYVSALEAGSAEDVVARGTELIDGAGTAAARAGAAQARDTGVAVSRMAAAIVAGERRLMRVVDVPVGSAGVAGYALDVQELEEARAELGLFAHAQRDMFDRLSAGVAQFAGDGSLTFWNSHFASLFALAPEWLRDRPGFDLVLERMREAQRAPESRDFPGWRAERRAWFASTDPVEESWLLPGGTHLRVVAQPLPDRGLLLIFEDRTEHLRLASARDTLLRVRTATFDNLFEAVGVFAADGRLQLWNHRFGDLWGLSAEQLARHPRIDQLVELIAARLTDPTRAAVLRDTVRVATLDRQHRSGRLSLRDNRHFEFAAVPLPDGNALFALLDVTAARENEQALRDRNEALEEANRLKNSFVASMSYELRVPLTSIAGFAEMLAGGYAGELGDTARDYINAIVTAVDRLAALMGDLLDLTQSEIGSLPMEMAPVALGEPVRAALDRAREAAWAAGLTLAADIAGDSGVANADERRLGQALDHLLRNAVAYTPPGGRVLASVRRDGTVGEITVADTGRGMSAEQIARAFDRLNDPQALGEQAPAATRGFGLPLARQLLEAQHGTLAIASVQGQGTTVTLRLPLLAEAA